MPHQPETDRDIAAPPYPALETERLLLRPLALDDVPAMQKYFGTWDVIAHLGTTVPWPYPDDGALRFVEDVQLPGIAAGEVMAWVIVEKAGSGEAIGMIDYRPTHATDNRGFWLAVPFQGRGYMTEVVTAFQDFVFFELGVERLLLASGARNVRSRRVKEKTGAKRTGTRQIAQHSGETDMHQWEVTREAWAEIRGRGVGVSGSRSRGPAP